MTAAEPSPPLPAPRGEISEALLSALAGSPGPVALPRVRVADALSEDDLHLALYCCYELHYRSFAGVDPFWEWAPSLIAARQSLESSFEQRLREVVQPRTVNHALWNPPCAT